MKEIWKDIEGYEGMYQVSNCGRVKSLKSKKEIFLKNRNNGKGYLKVALYKENIQKNFYVHRLVANAFIPNPNNLPEVNHIDECKTNNFVSNIEFCDHSYNNSYGTHNKKISDSLTNNEKISKKIICVETNTIYPSSMEAQRQTGIYQGNIIKCCKGNRKSAGKFHWKYYI